jgi:hypothetical protein
MNKTLLFLNWLSVLLLSVFESKASNPVVIPMSPVTICIGSCVTLTATATGGTGTYTYSWSNNGTVLVSPLVCPMVSITYTVVATDNSGASSAPAQVTIAVNPPLEVIAGSTGGTSICPGGNVSLNAIGSGGNGIYSYTWTPSSGLSNPNISNPVATPTSTTTYTVIVSDNCGTPTDSDLARITVYPATVTGVTSTDTAGCVPFCVHFTSVSNPSCAAAVWTFGDGSTGTGCSSAQHCYPVAGTYLVTTVMTDINGCHGSASMSIVASPCAGIREQEALDNSLKLFPNPFSGALSLTFDQTDQKRTIQLFDVLGKMVFSTEATGQTIALDLTALPKGIFFLQVSSGQEHILRKVSKQ